MTVYTRFINVAADVAHMRTSRVTHMCMWAYVCACVHVCVINENKHPFEDFRYLFSFPLLIYPSNCNYFRLLGLFSSGFMCK